MQMGARIQPRSSSAQYDIGLPFLLSRLAYKLQMVKILDLGASGYVPSASSRTRTEIPHSTLYATWPEIQLPPRVWSQDMAPKY